MWLTLTFVADRRATGPNSQFLGRVARYSATTSHATCCQLLSWCKAALIKMEQKVDA
jgi:hypothetical protein